MLESILVPISVAVVLPIMIVWIVFRSSTNKDNKNAEIIMKAIENNTAIDPDRLIDALGKPKNTPQQILQARLLRGCIFTFVGIACCIFNLITAYVGGFDTGLWNEVLFVACVTLAVGIAYLVVYFATRKTIDKI